ncbi:DUF397 domain-containing protein [Streptomyces griseocarneus]|nr:DUF397 domain-containing protein [Streptomyces griseocarneus]
MSTHRWQKSSYSGNAANCLYVATDTTGAIRLRESDALEIALATSRSSLHKLIRTIKAGRLDKSGAS